MKRKLPRSQRLQKQAEKPVAVPQSTPAAAAPAQPPAPAAVSTSAVSTSAASLFGLATRLILLAVVVVFLALFILLISFRVRSSVWPAPTDVGLQLVWGATEAGLLVIAGLVAWGGVRLVGARRGSVARAALLVTLLLAIVAVGLRWHEYSLLRAEGLWQRRVARPIYDYPNVYYLQAVRTRLSQLQQELEDQRESDSASFSAEYQQRLELVESLTQNMVGWSEQQVGHWLDDLQLRRAEMDLVAYLVHPLPERSDEMTNRVQGEQRDLDRRRQWFELLLEYCQHKSQLTSGDTAATSDAASAFASGSSSETTAVVAEEEQGGAAPETLEALNQQLRIKLTSLGLADWPYAQSVMTDTKDAAMVGERLNQIKLHLAAMSGRATFLDDVARPLVDSSALRGLNRQYSWLQLPVCLPGGNLWAGGYFALSSMHMLLIVAAGMLTFYPLLRKTDSSLLPAWRQIAWWWTLVGAVGVVFFVSCYLI